MLQCLCKRLQKEAHPLSGEEYNRLQSPATLRDVATQAGVSEATASRALRSDPRVAEETRADVIAMSTNGRTGAARWLIGSVADRVARNSKVPVMLIRARA